MRQDQRERLEDISETVLDQFLDQGQVEEWPDMSTPENRADRYWFIKVKAAELAFLDKIYNVLERRNPQGANARKGEEESVERTIKKFEKQLKEKSPEALAAKFRKPLASRPAH